MSEAQSTGTGAPRPKPPIPRLPLLLGLAGLLPFWGLALSRVTGIAFGASPSLVAVALATYAATILAFLGGIRWGAVMRETQQTRVAADYGLSVLPQLLGWGALALPDPWRLFGLGSVVLALGPFDRNLVARGLAPPWFGRLRLILSLGAGIALFLAALA